MTECARRLGVARNTLSRLLHGRLGISPKMALVLERIGWGNADHWMRMQSACDLAQRRRPICGTGAAGMHRSLMLGEPPALSVRILDIARTSE